MAHENTLKQQKQLQAITEVLSEIGARLDYDLEIELWDGSRMPLGPNPSGKFAFKIASPGVITSLLRHPNLDRFIRHYIKGDIDFLGGTLFDICEQFTYKSSRKGLKDLPKLKLLWKLVPFIFAHKSEPGESRSYHAQTGQSEVRDNDGRGNDKAFIQFHYDLSNEFYALFLDPAMVYTCGYFTDWNNTLEQAQYDKLDMVCRKLRLQEGERFLDIGCGWGGLVCHAAKHYKVKAHGVTLSEEQLAYARARVKSEGLEDYVTLELLDYRDLDQSFDKIASIGMYEAIGAENIPTYMRTVDRLLVDKGLFLNHAISRKGGKKKKKFGTRPEQRALVRYIFPGGELDDLGNTIRQFEAHGFEVMDVEGWREHYQLTTKIWCDQLTAHKDEAIALIGEETYRIWVVYLAGVSLTFLRGGARIYQTLLSKNPRGRVKLPPTRADLYRR